MEQDQAQARGPALQQGGQYRDLKRAAIDPTADKPF